MSVRRLAEQAVQPASFAFTKANAAEAKRWIKKYPAGRQQSAVIPLLMIAQEQEGWVTKAAIEHIADSLGMPYIRALEVATFYTQYQLKPVGTRAHVQVCGEARTWVPLEEKDKAQAGKRQRDDDGDHAPQHQPQPERVEAHSRCPSTKYPKPRRVWISDGGSLRRTRPSRTSSVLASRALSWP